MDAVLNLAPLVEPPPVSAWPPSVATLIALLLLIGITLFCLVYLIKHFIQKRRQTKMLQQYLKQLKSAQTTAEITLVLKLICRHNLPSTLAQKALISYGEAWLNFLNQQLEPHQQWESKALSPIGRSFYQNSDSPFLPQYQLFAQHWILHKPWNKKDSSIKTDARRPHA